MKYFYKLNENVLINSVLTIWPENDELNKENVIISHFKLICGAKDEIKLIEHIKSLKGLEQVTVELYTT